MIPKQLRMRISELLTDRLPLPKRDLTTTAFPEANSLLKKVRQALRGLALLMII